jgi:uncharacterized membrane protein
MNRGDTRLVTGGTTIGVGLAGFVDGILFHQILQWHEMVSSVVPPIDLLSVKLNMLYDGVFHAVMWVTTVVGILFLVGAVGEERRLPVGPTFGGAVLVGWGVFNVVEGLVDHQWLGLHHLHPGAGQAAWDAGFIVVSAALAVVGAAVLVHTVRQAEPQLGAA